MFSYKRSMLIFLPLMLGCTKDNFKKYVALEDLRIVAIKADSSGRAEGSPGDVFSVTPYVVDLNSSGPITASAVACVDPGVSYGANASCVGNPTLQTLTVSSLTAPYADAAPAIAVTIPSAILSGRSLQEQYNGVNYLIIYSVTNSNGNTVTAVKRIPISTRPGAEQNHNPIISRVLGSGSPLSTLSDGAVVDLSMEATVGSAETYNYYTSSGNLSTASETLMTTWFYSDGELKYYRTVGAESTSYTAPSSYPSGRSSFLFAVLRDGRGGESVQKTIIHP